MSDTRGSVEAPVEESNRLQLPKTEPRNLGWGTVPAHPRLPTTSSETAGRSVGEEATVVSPQTPIDPSKLANFLPAMATKWFVIGLKLGCKDTAMELRSSTEPPRTRCFVVIDEWMSKEGESACSWEYLCRDVLRSEGVGLGDVADRIEQELNLESSRQASSQAGGSGVCECHLVEVKNCEIQQLQARVKELEEDREQMVAHKQQEIKELTAKCVAAEEGRRRAEEGRMEMEREKERLESEFERYRFSQEELVRDLTEEKQQLAETNTDTTDRLALLERHRLDMAAELKKQKEQLVKKNAVLDKENEEYSEEVADLRQTMKEMEAELEGLRSVLQWATSCSCNREPKRPITHFVSSPSCISEEVLPPEAASLAVKDLLQCDDEEVQNHLKTFFEVMNTSSQHVTYTSGSPYRDWRCLAMLVGLHVSNLQATSCEKRLSIILDEWARKETVTVAKLHEVLVNLQCTRAAGCLAKGSAAHVQSTLNQEEEEDGILDLGDGILDLGDEADQSC